MVAISQKPTPKTVLCSAPYPPPGTIPSVPRYPRTAPLRPRPQKVHPMSLGTILLIILILALVGALPTWGHSRAWGYGPSGGLGLVVVVLLILVLMGRI